MTNPITPPTELVQQWLREFLVGTVSGELDVSERVLIAVAQWGWDQREPEIQAAADQELEASVSWLIENQNSRWAHALRAARRPKPPSLKEQALTIIDDSIEGGPGRILFALDEVKAIRRALEALPDD